MVYLYCSAALQQHHNVIVCVSVLQAPFNNGPTFTDWVALAHAVAKQRDQAQYTNANKSKPPDQALEEASVDVNDNDPMSITSTLGWTTPLNRPKVAFRPQKWYVY